MPLGHVAPVFVPSHKADSNLAGPIYDVLVGDHEAVFVDDETRPGAGTRYDLDHAGQRVFRHISNGQAG